MISVHSSPEQPAGILRPSAEKKYWRAAVASLKGKTGERDGVEPDRNVPWFQKVDPIPSAAHGMLRQIPSRLPAARARNGTRPTESAACGWPTSLTRGNGSLIMN